MLKEAQEKEKLFSIRKFNPLLLPSATDRWLTDLARNQRFNHQPIQVTFLVVRASTMDIPSDVTLDPAN